MWRSLAWLAALKNLDQLPPADAMPTVDLEIRFDDGKTDVSQASLPALDALGKALAEVAAKDEGTAFIIGVFGQQTDGSDKDELAFRRAEAIKQYLVTKYQLNPVDLLTVSINDKPKDFCCVRVFNLATKPKNE